MGQPGWLGFNVTNWRAKRRNAEGNVACTAGSGCQSRNTAPYPMRPTNSRLLRQARPQNPSGLNGVLLRCASPGPTWTKDRGERGCT